MKKVLAIALLCAVSSFATWDKFPILGAGKGEAKAGVGYLMQDESSAIGIEAGARFSVIEGLEVALYTLFPMSYTPGKDIKCSDLKDFGLIKECPPSMAQPAIGVRYWLPLGLGIALDVALPFQGDFYGGNDAANLTLSPALQYSTNLTSELSVGAEVSLDIALENKDKYAPGMELGIGVEFDYAIGNITPYIGVDVGLGLGNDKFDGNELDDTKAETAIDIGLGAIFKINDSMGADIGVTYGLGDRYKNADDETKSPITILAHFSYYF